MKRWGTLLFGLGAYATFLGVFLYLIGFVGNLRFLVPTSLDGEPRMPLVPALAIDLLLVALFALQHSVMARPGFKQKCKWLLPVSLERSAYVLATSLVMAVMYWQWQPLGGTVWNIQSIWGRSVLYVLFGSGWLIVLVTTFLINHFDLFGLRQVWMHFRGQPYTSLGFVTPGPYRWVRHPLYVGWLLAFWSTPTMGTAQLVFAVGMTAYILVAIKLEERDLVGYHGTEYEMYRRRVPMLIPRLTPIAGRPGMATRRGRNSPEARRTCVTVGEGEKT